MRTVPSSECVAVEYVVRVTAQADGTNREGLWVCAVEKILVVATVIGVIVLSVIRVPVIIIMAIIMPTQAVPWMFL